MRYCRNGEEPRDVYPRVAKTIGEPVDLEKEFLHMMREKRFMPASPVLMNAGPGLSNFYSPCTVLEIKDDMESILETLKRTGIITKLGGGVGYDISQMRESNSPLSCGGVSSGPLSFMKIYNSLIEEVKQGGVRKGAMIGIMRYDHPDIFNFIDSKINTNKFNNFNFSVMLDNKFMNAVINEEKIPIISRYDNSIIREIRADELLYKISFAAENSGDPGIMYYDRINKDNPLYPEKPITASNPCFSPDTLILDNNKLVRIDEGYNAETWTSWETGIKEVLKLTCNNGLVLKVTPDHKIMKDDGEFIEAKDSLGVSLKWGLGDREYTEIIEERVLQGFLFGDGYNTGGKLGMGVKLNIEKEVEVADLLLRNGFNIENCGEIYINKKNIGFINIDFIEKRVFERDLPDKILHGDSNIVASFLRGLFEANGSISRINQISLKGTCLSMIKKVQLLLASFGIPSWITTNPSKDIKWSNGTYTSKESYNLQIAPRNAKIFKEKIGFYSKQKHDKIEVREGEYKSKLKVIKIETIGEMEVWDYNMKTPPHYNFCNGVIAANCGEAYMFPEESCNLISVNLNEHITNDHDIDISKLSESIELATKFLLSSNELCQFPYLEMEEMAEKYKRIGVGITGFADALIKMHVMYDSRETLEIIDTVGSLLKDITDKYAHDSISKRAIAPDGSRSILLGASSSIEPVYKQKYIRYLTLGEILEERPKSEYMREAHDINANWRLEINSRWQKYIDNGISTTINLPYDKNYNDIMKIYMRAWEKGLKGITVFIDKTKDSVYRECRSGVCDL